MGGWNRGTTQTPFGQACCLFMTPSQTSPGSYTHLQYRQRRIFQTSLAFKLMYFREIGTASKLAFVLSLAPYSARFRRERRAVAVCHGWLNLDYSAGRDGRQTHPPVDAPVPILAGGRPHNRCPCWWNLARSVPAPAGSAPIRLWRRDDHNTRAVLRHFSTPDFGGRTQVSSYSRSSEPDRCTLVTGTRQASVLLDPRYPQPPCLVPEVLSHRRLRQDIYQLYRIYSTRLPKGGITPCATPDIV